MPSASGALPVGLFFTGTDTGVGKTFVTAAVTRVLRNQGRCVVVRKPVATGARWVEGRLLSDDTLRLAAASGEAADPQRITTWTFAEPLAPSVAARRQGLTLRFDELVRTVQQEFRAGKAVLVEGVGGLLCPLTDTATVADWAAALGLPLVIVARRGLGTLNHTLLTLEAARNRRLLVAGIVVNETQLPTTLAEETNLDELRRWIDVPVLALVPFQTGPEIEVSGELAEVDWWHCCCAALAKPNAESRRGEA
jgi:dethiobiotin synthetase